ncbi:GNAT family N-acetyltransferase [Jeotgalibacillus marinus]|uniref:GNAT family N-acetyltransferase n=1 Tax=Jeotgalibacillus marinus TaxID=86667 RepID=A0ABV3Q6Q5_9BACL
MIETERCLLYVIQQSNYKDVKELYLNKDVREFLGGTREEEGIQGTFDEMINSNNDSSYWIVRNKKTNEFIGLVSLDPHHIGNDIEISYQFLPKWWGAGYATEVMKEIIKFAFESLNLSRVIAVTQTANISSRKLLERLGMKLISKYQRFGADQSLYSIESNS